MEIVGTAVGGLRGDLVLLPFYGPRLGVGGLGWPAGSIQGSGFWPPTVAEFVRSRGSQRQLAAAAAAAAAAAICE